MRRLLSVTIIGSIFLSSCHADAQLKDNEATNTVSTNKIIDQRSNELPTDWHYVRISNLPLQIALPKKAIQKSTSHLRKGRKVDFVEIYSDPIWHDSSFKIKPDYFSFSFPINIASAEKYLSDYCTKGFKPYKITKMNDIEFTFFSRGCPNPSYSFVLGNQIYVIDLPQGDWGENAGKYFEIALKSIRPIAN